MFSWVKKEEDIIRQDIIKTEKLFWNYKNLILLALSVVVAIFILRSEFIKDFISGLGGLEYIGAFVSGLFFSYGLTTAPAVSILGSIKASDKEFIILSLVSNFIGILIISLL